MAWKEIHEARPPRPIKVAAPPPAAGKPLLEVLIVPVTLALITAVVTFAGTRISASTQRFANERSFRSTQVAAVELLAAKVGAGQEGEMANLAPRLIAYEEFAIPVFFGALQRDDLAAADRQVVERSLVHIGSVSGHVDGVGKAMLLILQDPWQLYGYRAHDSALRVVSSICFREAEQAVLAWYDPEKSVRNWVDVRSAPEEACQSSTETKECFLKRLGEARQRLVSAACPERPWWRWW